MGWILMIPVTPLPMAVVQLLLQQRQMLSKVLEGCQTLATELHPQQQLL
jgi:hypothetical protein